MLKKGMVYVVATPIGNLQDISARAIEILRSVDKIAVEDPRHSQRLLKTLSIAKPLMPLHEHNEREQALTLLAEVEAGLNVALISDAGTPLISDPGYHLIRLAHERQISVVPIPGPCAMITALSASGLPTDRFSFEGFLPAKSVARHKVLEALANETRTLIFFEAPHRVKETFKQMSDIFGRDRVMTIARELTKTFESIRTGTGGQLLTELETGAIPERGEFVILVEGKRQKRVDVVLTPEVERVVKVLLAELPVKQAARLGAAITGVGKNILYEYAIELLSV